MLNPATQLIQLSGNEYIKYSKQLILNNISVNGQKRIKNSKILIIGLGGLGNPTALYLAISGIGYIGLVDEDNIELSNLNRQIMYRERDIGELKVISAKNVISRINYNCKVITHTCHINKNNSHELIRYYDIIIDTTDNFITRYIINEACHKLHKSYIYGAVEGFAGQIGIFNYKDGVAYENLYPQYLNLKTQNCNTNGIMGIATGYIGILQAIEAIKIITGNKNKLNNTVILCDLMNIELRMKKVYKKHNRIDYNKNYKDTENKKELGTIKKNNQTQGSIILIDIRSNKEFNKKHPRKSINIPLKAFKVYKTLNFIKRQNTQKHLQIYCETLHKSIIVATILKNNEVSNYFIANET